MKLDLEPQDLEAIADKVSEKILERLRPFYERAAGSGGERKLYSIRQAADLMGRGQWAIRQMVADGRLPCIRDGKRILVERTAIDTWILERKEVS